MMLDPNTARALYNMLLSLYPRGFREQLGESMEHSFNDLCNERKWDAQSGCFSFIAKVWTGTMIDQLPCFLGVPLCD